MSGRYLGDPITYFVNFWVTDTDDVGQIALLSLHLLVCSSVVICLEDKEIKDFVLYLSICSVDQPIIGLDITQGKIASVTVEV